MSRGRIHNIGTYLGAATIVDERDVDLIEIIQFDARRTGRDKMIVILTPEMAPKLREILNRRHAEGRE